MIGIAECDEFLALLVDWKEGNIPAIGVRGILNLAGGLMWNDLKRHPKLCGECAAECDGHPAIVVAILDGELRGGRRRDGNRKPQFSGWSELFQYRLICHRVTPKNRAARYAARSRIARRNYGFIPAGAPANFSGLGWQAAGKGDGET